MKAEIIAVGTELLTGQIVNTNAQFLSEQLAQIGVDVYFQTTVGDNPTRLSQVIQLAQNRSDLIILTGGLGPTDDDLTKQTLATVLNVSLKLDSDALDKINQRFAVSGKVKTANNDRQALVLDGGVALANKTGLAAGSYLEKDHKTYVLLPGPPSELRPMVLEELLPLLSKGKRLYSRVLRFIGIGESLLTTLLADIITQQTDPTVAPYAKTGEVTLRLSTKADSQQEADQKLDQLEHAILSDNEQIAQSFYGYGDETTLASVVVHLLKEKGLTITAAESLTAGLFQASLATVNGVSQVFDGGFVTYSIEQKAKLLGIPLADLEAHGVVSAFTAEQMAQQSRKLTQSDIGIGLTGVAGPDSLEGQAVGTVYIGLSTATKTFSLALALGQRSRQEIREISVLTALDMVRKSLLTP